MTSAGKRQIERVLSGDLRDLVEEMHGPPPHTPEQISSSVCFTRDDALAHVEAHGFPPGSYRRGDSPADGVHLDHRDGIWAIWYSERGLRCLEYETADADRAREALVDILIYLSGLGGAIAFTEKFDKTPLDW